MSVDDMAGDSAHLCKQVEGSAVRPAGPFFTQQHFCCKLRAPVIGLILTDDVVVDIDQILKSVPFRRLQVEYQSLCLPECFFFLGLSAGFSEPDSGERPELGRRAGNPV